MAVSRARFLSLSCVWVTASAQVLAQPAAPPRESERPPARSEPPPAPEPESESESEAEPEEEGTEPAAAEGASDEEAVPAAPPAEVVRRPPVLTLERCLALAERNYPKVLEAQARLRHKRAQRTQAHYQPYTEFTFTAGLAPAPTVRGTAVYSPDTDLPLTGRIGVAWQVGIEGLVPLWTFGKITNTWDAAAAQVTVGEHEVLKEKNDVRLAVRRAYYGAMLAADALALIGEATKIVDKYMARLEERVEEGEGDEIELIKLRLHREELTVRASEAQKQQRIALSGLRFLTGYTRPFSMPDEPLEALPHKLGPLARYLAAARLYRPEINMARAGVLAREAQVRLERAKLFPDIGIALNARYANAPTVTDQRNPFVVDPGHGRSYGAALALRYKFDFLPQLARLAQARAQLEEIRATEQYALGGVGVEVETAYRDAEDALLRLEAYECAAALARKWLIQVQQGIDVGTFDDEDIVDPAREYALKRFSQMSATFDYNLALARLSQATGWNAVARERAESKRSAPASK